MTNFVPTPTVPAPDIVRCAYMELVVTDLAQVPRVLRRPAGPARHRGGRERHLPALPRGVHPPQPGAAQGTRRRRRRLRLPGAVARGGGRAPRPTTRNWAAAPSAARKASPRASATPSASRIRSGFPYEFFYDVEHVERLTQRYDLYSAGELVRLDHFNQVTPDVPRGRAYLEDLGFRVSEDIQDSDGVTYAAWMHRKQTVHDTALTGGNGPRMHHIAFATHEKHNIIQICDKMGALRISDRIERGPGRHGVSNAFYLYILRPGRPPHRDLHPGLLHRRPGQPHHHLGRARQPAPRLVGQPRGPVLVHRGLPGPGPRRQPAARRRPRARRARWR